MAIYIRPEFSYSDGIPPHDTPVEEKEQGKYNLQWAKYIYSSFVLGQTAVTADMQNEISYLRSYAAGNQDWVQYKKKFEPVSKNNRVPITSTVSAIDDDGAGGTWQENIQQSKNHTMAVDYQKIFSPAPKYMNALIGMFMQYYHDISVTALDRHSTDLKKELKWQMWVKSKNKGVFDEIEKLIGIPPEDNNTVLPNSLQELELYEAIKGFKLRYETAMEEALIHTEDISEFIEIMRKVIYDLACGGISFTCSYLDHDIQKIKYRYLDPEDSIIEYSSSESYSNSRFAGYVEYYTIRDLQAIFPNVNQKEWYDLSSSYIGFFGNSDKIGDYYEGETNPAYYDYRIPVLCSYYKTIDNLKKQKEVVIKGKVKPYELKKGKIRETNGVYVKDVDKDAGQTKAIYYSKWVIGTDYVFDFGRLEYDDGELPIQCYSVKGNSLVKQMIPSLDQIMMTYIRLQNAIAKAPPPGLLIDVSGLKGFKMGNSKWHPSDLIRIYTASGNMLYDSSLRHGSMPNDKVDSRKVIETLPGGMGNAINEYLISFEMSFNHIAELTGMTRESFASRVDPNQTATATKMLAAGTSNTLQPLYSGWISMRKGMSRTAAHRIQLICMNKSIPETKGYKPVIGDAGVQAIADFGKKSPFTYGIDITPAMNDEEKMELRRSVQEAQAAGFIEPDVAMFIVSDLLRGLSLNKAQLYLSYRIQLGKDQQAKAAEAAQLRDRETQLMVDQQKKEAEAAKILLESEEKIKQINVEKEWDYKIEELKVRNKQKELSLQD